MRASACRTLEGRRIRTSVELLTAYLHLALRTMHVVLIGYRGTGKSTVGRLVAERLGRAFFDADRCLEERAGKSIKAIFDEQGEAAFRQLEVEVTAELMEAPPAVLSMGGGVVLRAENREAIAAGKVVWLTASPETVHDRLAADPATHGQRPNLTATGGYAEIRDLMEERQPLYLTCCDHEIATDGKMLEQIAEEIVSLVECGDSSRQ